MKYFRLLVVIVVFGALIYWLRQCTSSDSGDTSADIGLTPAQIDALKQGKTDALVPSTATAPAPRPATGS